MEYKKRVLDKRYKEGVDTGAMSHLSLPLPLISYSEIKRFDDSKILESKKAEIQRLKKLAKEKFINQKLKRKPNKL